VSRAIENAQRKVEAHNFDIRKNLLDFDDVANDQRRVIYAQRNELMEADDVSDYVEEMRDEVFNGLISRYMPPESIEEMWDAEGLEKALEGEFGIQVPVRRWLEEDDELTEGDIRKRIMERVEAHFRAKEEQTGSDVMRNFEKAVMLNVLDQQWKEHLASMDYLRRGIHLRGFAQKKPQQEYKREGFEMFTQMLDNMRFEVMKILARVEVRSEQDVEAVDRQRQREKPMEFQHREAAALGSAAAAGGQAAAAPAAGGQPAAGGGSSEPPQTFVREGRKVGRNEPCPCGSGKKYKHCHGKID
jgi:preprotein translocase subunit SecA